MFDMALAVDRSPAAMALLRRSARAAADPVRFAPPTSRTVLSDDFRRFMGQAEDWRRAVSPGLLTHLSAADHRTLVSRLSPRPDDVELFIVSYPAVVLAAIGPSAFILGTPRAAAEPAQAAYAQLMGAMTAPPSPTSASGPAGRHT